MSKRLISVFLCLSVVFAVLSFVSCGGGEKTESVTTAAPGPGDTVKPGDTAEESVETEPPVTEAQCPVEQQSLNGYEYLILEGRFNLNTQTSEFSSDEDDATIIGEAVFRRNKNVEDRLDIIISSKSVRCTSLSGSPEGYGEMMKEKQAGEANYDTVILPAYDQTLMSYNGCNYDFFHIDNMDFEAEYWDQQVVREIPIKGLLLFITGDFSIDCFDATAIIAFNKKLAKEYGVNDLYTLAENGKWTLDKFEEYTRLISEDLDGDGFHTDKDKYGALLWDDSMYALINAAGERCCKVDADGNIILTLGTERIVTAFQRYCEFGATKYCLRYQQNWNYTTGKGTNNSAVTGVELFSNDQGLFFATIIGNVLTLRDMETDYGILPEFKYDESQDGYQCTVAPYNVRFMSIPVSHPDIELVGKVLETIGFYSSRIIVPAYYERTLIGAVTRDEESAPMLDIIRSSRVYDLGYYFNPASISYHLLYLFRDFDPNWTSRYASLEKAATKVLNRINTSFDKLVDTWSK